jgi:lauroyl/myristoyl acyltransferase
MRSRQTLAEHAAQAVRFNGLWWRKLAYLGSVHGPEWWKRWSPPFIAATIFALVGPNRRGAIANMQRVLGTDDSWTGAVAALRMFTEFAYCMSETLEYYSPRSRPLRLELPERDPIVAALDAGRGVVLVTGHFGNWDIAAKTLREYGRPVNVVMAHDVNESTQAYVRAARERAGVRVIFSDTSVFSSLNMIRALRENEVVAIQLDRMLGAGGARLLPFLGHPAPFPSGPFALARLAAAPVIPVFIPRLGPRHYRVHVGEGVTVPREARDGAALDRVMQAIVSQFEAIVRRHPTQWFQFTPFWPDAGAPAGTAPRELARESESRHGRG